MSDIHSYDWWLERIEVAHTESETPGARSFFGQCPVHGGSDSFHVTEKNGKAQVHCFGCSAKYSDVLAALDTDLEGDSGAPQASQREPKPIVVVRRSSGRKDASPLAWCAQRCGMGLDELLALDLPLSEEGDRLVFEFDGRAKKTRAVGEGKKKDILWEGALNPPLWPVPTEPLPEEITITEGEFDCIVLRRSGYVAFSITGGSTNPPDAAAFLALGTMGVERVEVAFDEDEAGRKARQAVTESIRAAGLIAVYGRPKGLEPLYDEKDARDVAARVRAENVELENHPDTELNVRILADIEPAKEQALLIGRLDPNDHTILFGDGGTGKGVIAAWWAAQLSATMTVLILDYENHADTEWRKRLEAFSGDMSKVYVVSPTAAIWDIAGPVTELIKELRVGYVIVDSAIYACVGSDAYTPEAATKYSLAIAQFGKPVLTLAHKTKSKDEQSKPFGSVFWHNGARLIISVEAKGYDDDRIIKTQKSNHGDDFHRAIKWDWVRTGLPPALVESDVAMSATATVDALIIRAVEEGKATTRKDIDNYVLASNPDAGNIGNRVMTLAKSGMISYDKASKEYGPKEPE